MINKNNSIMVGLVAIICLGIAAAHIYTIVSIGLINRDGGFYIQYSKMVLNGKHILKDFRILYTPLLFYSFAFWMKLFGTSYTGILLLVQLVNLANAFVLFFLLMRLNVQRVLGFIISLSYFSYVLNIGGQGIFIEPFQIFFALLAYYAFLKKPDSIKNCGMVGFLIGISIMYKQFSIIFLISGLFAVFLVNRKNMLRASKGCGVFLVASVLPLLIFCLTFNLSVIDAILLWFGPQAGEFAASDGWKMYLNVALFNQYRIISYISILAVFGYLSCKTRSEIGTYVLPFYLFSTVFFIMRPYSHYYQLAIIWQFLVMGWLINLLIFEWNEIKTLKNLRLNHAIGVALLCLLLFFAIKPIIYNSKTRKSWKSHYLHIAQQNKEKKSIAKQINQIFPKGSRVLIFKDHEYYIYCDLLYPENNIGWPLSYEDLDKNVVDNVLVTGINERYYVTGGHHIIYPDEICNRLIADGYIEILQANNNYMRFFTKAAVN